VPGVPIPKAFPVIPSAQVPLPSAPSPGSNPNLLVVDGNSLTDGRYSSYPLRTLANLGDGWTLRNFGVNGQTTGQMLLDAKKQIDPLIRPNRLNVLAAWEITNELRQGAPREAAYERFRRYCLDRRAAGWKVIALTVLPRTQPTLPLTFEADRSAINADMRAHWREFADGLADVAADPRLGDAGDELDVNYFRDGIHPTPKGDVIVANAVAILVRKQL